MGKAPLVLIFNYYDYLSIPFLYIKWAPAKDTTTPMGISTPVPNVPLNNKRITSTAMGSIDMRQCFAKYDAHNAPNKAGVTC